MAASEKPKYKKRADKEKKVVAANESRPVSKQTKNSIFDDSEDDLFSVTSKEHSLFKDPLKSDQSKESLLNTSHEKNSREDSGSPIITTGEFISSVSAPVDEDEADGGPTKPKKPVGGVSMFGSIDPLAARNKLKSQAKNIGE